MRGNKNADALRAGLANVPGLELPSEPERDRTHVYHQFTVRDHRRSARHSDEFVDELTERGVGCGIYYPSVVFDYDCYRSHPRVVTDRFPNAERAATEVVSLPVHPYLEVSDLDTIVTTVREVLGA